VYNANEVDVPDVMIDDETENMLGEFENRLRYQGVTLEQYLEYINKDVADLKNELRVEALKKVKTRMLLTKIAEQEKFEVTEEEMEKEITTIAGQYGMETDKVKEIMGDRTAMVEKDIKVIKAVDFIFSNAVIK